MLNITKKVISTDASSINAVGFSRNIIIFFLEYITV